MWILNKDEKDIRAENAELKKRIKELEHHEEVMKIKEETMMKSLDSLRRLENEWKASIDAHKQAREKYNELIEQARSLVLEMYERKRSLAENEE